MQERQLSNFVIGKGRKSPVFSGHALYVVIGENPVGFCSVFWISVLYVVTGENPDGSGNWGAVVYVVTGALHFEVLRCMW